MIKNDFIYDPIKTPELAPAIEALSIWNNQIKPKRGLGDLEDLAVHVAKICGTARPSVTNKTLLLFCSDHGIAEEGVSIFQQDITSHLTRAALAGKAAVSVFCEVTHSRLEVIDIGLVQDVEPHPQLTIRKIAKGTRNIRQHPAMERSECLLAIEVGRQAALKAIESGSDVIGIGEIGIGNTTSASAIASAILRRSPEVTVGRGTGISDDILRVKKSIVAEALALHRPNWRDPIDCLSKLGGFEIAGMSGAIMAASAKRVPIVIDGFVATIAALCATQLDKELLHYLIFSHKSAEQGHAIVLQSFQATPLLDLKMCLGEGTGAVLGMMLVELSCRLLTDLGCF